MYIVQTVSSRPRPWSSYTNVNSKEVRGPTRMNSAEEISKYNDYNNQYCSPVLARRTGGTRYDLPEKSPKKDKKWSLGSLFRRKKKNGSESSSEEENQSRNVVHKKKKKTEKRKRTNKAIAFDHVVVPPSSRNNTLSNGYRNHDDLLGVLSEPTYTGHIVTRNFIPASDFVTRLLPPKDSQDSLNRSNNSLGSPSVNSLGRKYKKEVIKARAEARRDHSKGGDSSDDDDSQRSPFRSDESLTKQRDGSTSRRSRTARTQRYLKRRSRDEEGRDQLRTCKSDIEHDRSRNMQHLRIPDERMQNMKSSSKSPILSPSPKSKLCYTNSAPSPSSSSQPNFSGLSTIPPSHSSYSKYKTINFTNGSSQKSSSFHDYNDVIGNKFTPVDLNNQRSLSCDFNTRNATPSPDQETEVVHVQFPLGKPFSKRSNVVINQHLNQTKRQPPPPPPRDPRRILTVQNTEGRPVSYSFETGYPIRNGSSDHQLNKIQSIPESNRNYNLNPKCRSTSEDHISLQPTQRVALVSRPSSTTPETNKLQKLSRTYPETQENANNFRYLTDKNPRSRKPICIQNCDGQNGQQNKCFQFWRQKEEEAVRSNTRKSTPGSPLMFTAQAHVRTNIFLPNGVKVETVNPHETLKREGSPFRPITSPKSPSPPPQHQNGSVDDEMDFVQKRKSANLEEALDELEAIYNSLHLGDEDLLENAEKREAAAARKRRDAAFESYPSSILPGNLSDSSFCYETGRRKRFMKRSEPDLKADDMAFRKLNKERYNTISDPHSAASRVSYLLTSPVFNTPINDPVPRKDKTNKNKEPDITFDDVVFRNVKHTNNTLKITDPQPPFGIPVGPVLPASNSDYLHALPEATPKYNLKQKKIPDVVKDDLAYRNLRKDHNKEPALPQTNLSPDDYLNNNNNKIGETLKKKNKAVRSLSANIFNLMHKEWRPTPFPSEDLRDSKQNLEDVADALEIARQILREKENKINATRKAFLSDGELGYRKFGCTSPTEYRLNYLNEKKSNSLKRDNVYHHKLQVNISPSDCDRLEAKPPTPDRRSSRPSTKESTPIPVSPSQELQLKKQPEKSSLDDFLKSIALETKETGDRITNELILEKEKEKQEDEKIHERISSPVEKCAPEKKLKNLEEDATSCSLILHLSDGESTADHAKLCEKLLECVVESKEYLASNSKLEPELCEEVEHIKIEPLPPETVANVVLTPSNNSKLEINPNSTEVFSESDHDYVNIQSGDEEDKQQPKETEKNSEENVQKEHAAEVSSSTEIDEEEKELLRLDDDAVSADICVSPLEKHKEELVTAFQELKSKYEKSNQKETDEKKIEQTDKGGERKRRSRSCGARSTSTQDRNMSELKGNRAERMARYKEERRKQLASQFAPLSEPQASPRRKPIYKDTSSSSEEPRTTRASRLRAAVSIHDTNGSSSSQTKIIEKEKSPASVSNGGDSHRNSNKYERDKSNKRKSNLNRALNSEEVPQLDTADDAQQRRRRRRFFPPEILQQAVKDSSPNDENSRSDSLTASSSITSTSTASSIARTTPKKSELSIHMENARKGFLTSYSEMGKYGRASPKRGKEKSPKLSSTPELDCSNSLSDSNSSSKLANKENIKSNYRYPVLKQDKNKLPTVDNDQSLARQRRSSNVSRRMDELTALTRETLARVERLTNKSRDSPKRDIDSLKKVLPATTKSRPYEVSSTKDLKSEIKADTRVPLICDSAKSQTHSILKKKSTLDELYNDDVVPTFIQNPPTSAAPVSILKRKVSQDEFRSQGGSTPPTNTPPVTFSPSVVDPATNRKKQGILKKRRSLDEAQVLRHRSYSPEGALNDGKIDSRSILKNQRRSSLEEIIRTQSPESGLHGILKRKTSRHEDEIDPPINSPEPHGILKRKSGTSSAGSVTNSSHVSIATAVILAAAGGAEMILEPNEPVKPILKKKSFSDEQPSSDSLISDVPKPILKKKSSTDTEDCEDRPKKPILKNTKSSLDDDFFYQKVGDDSECEVRPILKQGTSRENSPRPRLSFFAKEEYSSFNVHNSDGVRHQKSSRRSHTICTDFNVNISHKISTTTEDRELKKSRPLSVCDMVLSIEKKLSTGAVPKKPNLKRHSERYRTQPVTYHELEASLSSVQKPLHQPADLPAASSLPSSSPTDTPNHNAHSLLDLTTSFDIDSNLNSFLSTSLPNTTLDSGVCGKMSSDSAFQSLGDGLELEQEEKSPSPIPTKVLPDKMEPARLQMKALAEEARNLQLRKGGVGALKNRGRKVPGSSERPSSSRFSTQPVTLGEVQEATRTKKDADVDADSDGGEPSRLSLSERIKMFNQKISEDNSTKSKPRFTRFQTQPVTLEEVESARAPTFARKRNVFALEISKDESTLHAERKGILKSKPGVPQTVTSSSRKFPDSLKSVLKKHEVPKRLESPPRGLRSILKHETADFSRDEGISSDESESSSDSENGVIKTGGGSEREGKTECIPFSARLAKIVGEKARMEKFGDKRKTELRNSGDDTPQTSDGDSSGSREVRSIMEGDFLGRRRLRDKYKNEGLILKSKSQTAVVRNDEDDDDGELQTSGVRRSLTQATMPKTIAELQAKLQRSGDSDWRKRIPKLNTANEELTLLNVKNIYNEELTEKTSILAARKDELDAASKQWKSRVEQSDAVNFSIAGRMQQNNDASPIPINIPAADKVKRTPKARPFKGRDGGDNSIETSSTPASPEKNNNSAGFKRSISLPGAGDNESSAGSDVSLKITSRKVQVERPDNTTFTSFFESVNSKGQKDALDVSVDDFDSIVRQSGDLLVQKRTVKVQKRREATRNPVKALAARSDIKDEYTEVITGIAEKEKHRMNVEKVAKSSKFAVEALAGLASKEDFSSVALKRSSSLNSTYAPYKDLMLLQVKGRRFVQTRLVEPIADSINEGDNYILVTPDAVYNYVGAYANVIEQSRAADIVNSIQQTSDLGCKCDKIVSINSKKIGSCSSSDLEKFWKLLGVSKDFKVTPAGHPDEDEIYESSILGTNMIYEYKNEELVPFDTYWGSVPKIQMLYPTRTIVFDFGSEMYVWSGKNALMEDKKKALHLARELWNVGYNYTECGVNPIGISTVLGSRSQENVLLKDNTRPKWALFAKITQHRETVLFKEKFLDWPDYSRVIRVKMNEEDKNVDSKFDFKPCDVVKMQKKITNEPNLIVDGIHLGRGVSYYDEETNRLFNFTTRSVTSWVILEYSHEELKKQSVGQFHDGNSYIIRWEYCANITGRELSGKPSKHVQVGRDHCVYFCWQGNEATINEKGAAALLTIQLDSENARQIRVLQGSEAPAFLSLFQGNMVIHRGKREKPNKSDCKLYISQGEIESETFLVEVPCSMRSLRSRSSFVLVNCKTGEVIVWNGAKSLPQARKLVKKAADRIVEEQLVEFGFFDECDEISLDTVEEGEESKEFLSALGGEKRQLYVSLSKSTENYEYTPRLFHLSSLSGTFEATEILCPHRSASVTPYPFLQSNLYSANQPALFLFDNRHEVWLWQGWWPEREDDMITLVDQTGSGAVRWQEERKVAMQTVVDYYKQISGTEKSVPAYLVWAGLEPLAFMNLFPFWRERDDVTELNIQEGKKVGEAVPVERELTLLSRSTYPLEQLLQRPLPDGVDPTHLENYLSPEDFADLMSMTLAEFQKMPAWKQTTVKKEKGLF